MLETLASLRDLLLVILGFSFVIFFHELGHFLAARWAGVLVEQFAVGFGRAVVSYRRGVGFCRGSTRAATARALEQASRSPGRPLPGSTEYRLNWLPFGGYVKMLGQDDLNPDRTSQAPDSYNRAPVWKRMVIVSAGVAMNLLLAAAAFIAVFMIGLRTEPAKIGMVRDGSAAASAKPVASPGVPPGLRPGDTILAIDGDSIRTFSDIMVAVAMAERGRPMTISVARPGLASPIDFHADPAVSEQTRLLELGVAPASSNRLFGRDVRRERDRADIATAIGVSGLAGVEPGSDLIRVNGAAAASAEDLLSAVRTGDGSPVLATFRAPTGAESAVPVRPIPALGTARVPLAQNREWGVEHLLGLLAPMRVDSVEAAGEGSGLKTGDVLAQVGSVEWPDPATVIAEIRAAAGRTIPITVMRAGEYIRLNPRVRANGQVGFGAGSTQSSMAVIAGTLGQRHGADVAVRAGPGADAADRLRLTPGAIIERVDGRPVESLRAMRDALRQAVGPEGGETTLVVRLPLGDRHGEGPTETVRWTLTPADAAALHRLGWESPVSAGLFEPEQTTLRASGPLGAVAMGVHETHRVMMTTYLTLLRLTQGSVKVEHLKGPVGIAHLGTMVAERGTLYLLFFMALISVNLAVLNFLPLPIVDGGLFIFLLIEAIMRRPVSAAIQTAATMAGVLLIGAMFLIVTFNDIARLIGG